MAFKISDDNLASLKSIVAVLNNFYLVWCILLLIGTLLSTGILAWYGLFSEAWPLFSYYLIVPVMFFTIYLGKTALKRNDKHMTVEFAFLVLICMLGQLFTNLTLPAYSINSTIKVIKREMITNYQNLPMTTQRLVEMSQQNLNCCGIDGWQDFGKSPDYAPASCCGKYSAAATSNFRAHLPFDIPVHRESWLYDNSTSCSLNELNVKGCAHDLNKILASVFYSNLVYGIQIFVQLLVGILQLYIIILALVLSQVL